MTKSQKEEYVNDKLLELKNISEMYDKSGGKNNDFRKNIDKMQKFYSKMLEEEPQKTQFGDFAESRVQTPIGKLRESNLNGHTGSLQNNPV